MSVLLRFAIILALIFCSFTFTACTSGEEDTSVLESELENLDGEDGGELSDELDDEDDDLADIEDDELKDELDEGDEKDEFGEEDDEFAEEDGDDDDEDFKEFDESDEDALAKELGEEQKYPEGQENQPTFPEEVIAQNQPPQQEPVNPTPPAPQDGQFITSETQEMDVSDIPEPQIPQDDLGKADPLIPEEEENNQNQSWVPVVKIKADPFFRNEKLMNAVYIARPEDTLVAVSDKIFGSDKSKDLQDNNPHLAKGIDPGDKIYYNSPNRADDKSSLKVYYDDIGLEPQKYVTNKGDNMRRLGSKLLGFPEGWKEVWAINPNIDSKTILPAGTEIRYWTGEEQAAQVQALLEEESPSDASNPENPAQQATTEPQTPQEPMDPPPAVIGSSELPSEPPLPDAGIPEDEAMDPELLADSDPLPDEGELEEVPLEDTPTVGSTSSNDSLIYTGALALLLLGGAALVAIQIKNRKAQTEVTPPSLEYTQV